MPKLNEKPKSFAEEVSRIISEQGSAEAKRPEVVAPMPVEAAPVARTRSWADRDKPETEAERITREYRNVGQDVPVMTRLFDKSFNETRKKSFQNLADSFREFSSYPSPANMTRLSDSIGFIGHFFSDQKTEPKEQEVKTGGLEETSGDITNALHATMGSMGKPSYADASRAAHPQTEEPQMWRKDLGKYLSGVLGGRKEEGVLPAFYRPEREGMNPASYLTSGALETAGRFFGSSIPNATLFGPALVAESAHEIAAYQEADIKSSVEGVVREFVGSPEKKQDDVERIAPGFYDDLAKWVSL
jgi:hypothetical protein